MKTTDFVRKIFNEPNMPDDTADSILWGCTGWPHFFRTNNPVKEMVYDLRHAKRAFKRGFTAEAIYMGTDREQI